MTGKLNDKAVRTAPAGRYDDGDGLRLMVAESGKRSWVQTLVAGAPQRVCIHLGAQGPGILSDWRETERKFGWW